MRRPRVLLCLLSLLLLSGPASGQPGTTRLDAGTLTTLCGACHQDKFAQLGFSPHAVLNQPAHRTDPNAPLACNDCHGDVTEHALGGGGRSGVFAFRAESHSSQSAQCLGCHADDHPDFARSAHARADVTCTSCHAVHGAADDPWALIRATPLPPGFRQARATSAVCRDCHDDVFTQFAGNERHRLAEGTISCTDCHNPHAEQARSLLGGFKQAQCTGCHAENAGPFVFEHPASRVEGCTACHTPHGSANRHLLQHQDVAELCISCHAVLPQFHLGSVPGTTRFGLETQCTNCHMAIHGSQFHPRFLR